MAALLALVLLCFYCNLGNSRRSECWGPRRSAPVLPRKPCSAGKDSWPNAQVRTGVCTEFAQEIVVCAGFWANARLGLAAPRRFCREHRAPCWFLGKMLRSVGSRCSQMPGNSSNQGHYTPSAVVKCKFPLSELRSCGNSQSLLFPKCTTRTTLRFAKRMFTQQMALNIFVRILRARKWFASTKMQAPNATVF